MKINIKKLMVGLTMLLFLTDMASAGDSYTISISCTIPEIPGVNAPLIQEEAIIEQKAQNPQGETENESPQILQEDTEKEIRLANQEGSSLVLLKTLYSR